IGRYSRDIVLSRQIRRVKAMSDGVDLGTRFLQRGAVPQPSNHASFERRCGRDWQPEIVVVHESEAFRHYADDRGGDVVDVYGGPYSLRVIGEPSFPEAMADDGHGRGYRRFIGRCEVSPDGRPD